MYWYTFKAKLEKDPKIKKAVECGCQLINLFLVLLDACRFCKMEYVVSLDRARTYNFAQLLSLGMPSAISIPGVF